MCGIVGYVGPRLAAPILLDGLRKLEYRGYDSAGLAVHTSGGLDVVRSVGKLDNLSRALEQKKLDGTVGIGHTRWATHGRPSEPNAHPHLSGGVAVVHNGIIENHVELRRKLEELGVRFASETDSEIFAHLIERARASATTLFDAVRSALGEIRGTYGLAVVCDRDPGSVVVAKNASPLVIGLGDGETLCGSDIPALLGHTRSMLFLEDGELAELTASGARIETLAGTPVKRAPRRIDWSPMQAERGGYKHFMLKEIFEQPRALEDTLRGRIRMGEGDVEDAELGLDAGLVSKIDRVYFVACGTSHHATIAGRYWLEELARLPGVCELASEVRNRSPVFTERDLVVAVSQSGETADTLGAVRAAREAGARVLAIANVLDSMIPRASHSALYTHAGPEIGVASTKCFTAQLAGLLLLAVYLGRRRGTLSKEKGQEALEALLSVPLAMRHTLERSDVAFEMARRFAHVEHMLFLGRGPSYPIALEGALKLKEVSYAHAEGYAAGEMKHGPIALIDAEMPVVILMPHDRHYEKTLANVQEVRARDGRVVVVASDGDDVAHTLAEQVFYVPAVPELIQPLLTVIPLQLLSYHIADLKGTDVDQPRNLAKVVTVE
jgi:glucosamine--fructose-6-phosphate aminotransferase (isomerizing)